MIHDQLLTIAMLISLITLILFSLLFAALTIRNIYKCLKIHQEHLQLLNDLILKRAQP
jgi:hypothetical protein